MVVLMETRRTWELRYEHLDLLSVFCCHQPPLKPLWWDRKGSSSGSQVGVEVRIFHSASADTILAETGREAHQGASADTVEWLCYRWTVVKAWLSVRSRLIPSSRAGEGHLFTAR